MARPPKKTTPNESFAQYYGNEIRENREKKGWTQGELAAKLICDDSQVSRYELGYLTPQPPTARLLDELFGTGDYFTRHREVANVSRIPEQARALAYHEKASKTIKAFSLAAVFGLLQTESYVKALALDGLIPLAAESVAEERVRRQGILDGEDPARLLAIMDEGVFRRLANRPDLARDQIDAILKRTEQWNVQVQIVAQTNVTYPGLHGDFQLMEPRKGSSLAAWQSAVGKLGRVIEDPDIIADLVDTYDLIRSKAMSTEESHQLLKNIRESL
ncbi:helix-turn-helix domain-containing protein [Actinomadura rayongensis]|uniref:Helix-turn-helix domain-containing protein n=1 Tax=Actinomadura rayongensis TaxID=1429076 RepID=A0A6I4W3U1_9ACTN|nr:Scr1 family TA system antitoxin-like transcriptional regulator [Actinomadura rayongensis]MXQ63380.1 helix-turn-helix domain-containing protein [Actinomadura rayongensis]